LVIDADVVPGIAREFAPHQGAAMGAAVDEGLDGAGRVAVDDDRRLADLGDAEITRLRDFGFERQKAPGRALEDLPLLPLVDLAIVIQPIGHAAIIEGRPDRSGQHRVRLQGNARS